MPIRFIGLNNSTASIETRELFSFDASGAEAALRSWKEQFPNIEAAFVSTCNRTELYYAVEGSEPPSFQDAFPFLIAPKHKLDVPQITFERYASIFSMFDDLDAVKRLFAVTSSLDSMILGEPQILSQMKRAYELSVRMNSTGPILNNAFQTAFKTAKRITVETKIFKRRVSAPSVAIVDFALNLFERLTDKKTLVLGAGEMAEETLKYLVDYGAHSIVVSNRSREKAETLAKEWNGSVIDWAQRYEELENADLVVCATGASEYVISLPQCRDQIAKRKMKPLFILDLAVPRNIDPCLGELPNVYLYCIDDLESACARNRELRDKEVPKALQIVEEEARDFITKTNARVSIDAIRLLRTNWNKIKEAEVERLFHKISCDSKTEDEIRYAFDRLVNKLLHSPTTSLKDAAENESGKRLSDVVRRLFNL